jgi:hypothetical protein
MEIIIYDNRPDKEFNSATFSNYKKSEVIKALIKSVNEQDAEGALFWSVELLCSGRLKDLWDVYLQLMGKHIRSGNPKLPIYISSRFEKFKSIITNGYAGMELEVRNNSDMRILISEIICVLCFSPKKPALEMLKINKQTDFSLNILGKQLKADSMLWGKMVMLENDPNEILLAVNEFGYHLDKKNLLKCCYWIDWLIDFDALCRKQKKPIIIQERTFVNVEDKFKYDPIWILWDLLLIKHKSDKNNLSIINSLIALFSIRYNFSQKRKRRFLLYLAVELYTETIDMTIPIVHNGDKVRNIIKQQDKFYKAIKKYEQRPEIISDKQKNLQKSIGKMKLLYDIY